MNIRQKIRKILLESDNKQDLLLSKNFKIRHPEYNTLIILDVDKVLQRHANDSPTFTVLNPGNRIGNRVEKAEDFLKKYLEDDRWINPRDGQRTETKVEFNPSVIGMYNGALSFEDGRHRVLAYKQLGIKKAVFEIPKEQIKLFDELK